MIDYYSIYQQTIIENFIVFLLLVALITFFINQYFSKKSLLIAKRKKLFAQVNHRSSHSYPTPAIGGVSIFIVIFFTLLLVIGSGFDNAIGFTLASCFILFLTGIKDDLIGTSPRTKLLIQIFSALIFVLNPDFALGHLNSFLGMELINANWTYPIGIFFIVSLVNSFNFIDGIDGLAAMTAIVSFSVFGIYFFVNDHHVYTIFCVTLIGALASFLTFNFGKKDKKMFLGDTGTLVIGFLLAIFSLRIIELQPVKAFVEFYPENAPLFIFSILVIPVLDSIWVITNRLTNGKKLWVADRSHLHHIIIELGLTHIKATFILIALQILSIVGFTLLNGKGNLVLHFYITVVYFSYSVLFLILRNKSKLKTTGSPSLVS